LARGLHSPKQEDGKLNAKANLERIGLMVMGTKARAAIKKLAGYLMIELFVPGGTLVILGLLFFGGSFPGVQERVLGMLPKNLSALIRPAEPMVDKLMAPSAPSTEAHPTKG
jgi:hypothetical protein